MKSRDSRGYLATKTALFNYNMEEAPLSTKLILLTKGGVAVWGQLTGDPQKDADIWGWHPIPGRDKARERELGLTK